MIAAPTRTNLHWPVDIYRRVIRGEITEAEADELARGGNLSKDQDLRVALLTELLAGGGS